MNCSQPEHNEPEKSDLTFDAPVDLEAFAIQQGVAPIADPASLLGDFWPEEDTNDFPQTRREWRTASTGNFMPAFAAKKL